ncbi:MAG: LysM peptidoglycan-binding domain-containing protein [Acidimicrobiales bacterium]
MTPVPSDAGRPPGAARPRGAGGRSLALVGWTAFLLAALAFLHGVGGALAPPPLTDPGHLGQWFDQRQPTEAAVAIVRLLALGMAWYLLAVTVAGTVARLAGVRSLVRATDAVTVPVVRRLVTAALGVSVAAAVLTGAGGAAVADEQAGSPAASPAAETMRRLPDAGPDGAEPAPAVEPADSPDTQPAAPDGPPTMRRLPAAAPEGGDLPSSTTTAPTEATSTTSAPATGAPATSSAPSTTSTSAPTTSPPTSRATGDSARPPAATATPARSPAAAAGRTWRVQPGDHFWSVAERVLAEAWQRGPTDAEVDPYWRALVDANRAVLRDPGNADLLFPDQVIAVPTPPPAPAG